MKDDLREKSAKIVDKFKSLNRNTVYKSVPQTEEQKKLRIRVLKVEKWGEEAIQFQPLIKSEVEARKKTDQYKKGKIPTVKKPKLKKVPTEKKTKAPAPAKPKPVKAKPEGIQLKNNTKIGRAWVLFNQDLTFLQIAEEMGVTRQAVGRMIYTRRSQLGITTPIPPHVLASYHHQDSKMAKYWELREQGLSVKEIAAECNVSLKTVYSSFYHRRKTLGLIPQCKLIGKKVQRFKKKGLNLKQIEDILKDAKKSSLRYYYYYKK